LEKNFVHLHTHSHYSLLDGLAKPRDLANYAAELKMPALAITDHGNLHGAVEFFKECKNAKIKPIIGCEFFVAVRSLRDKEAGIDNKRFHLILLAKNKTGWKNLTKMVSTSFLHGIYYKPRIDFELLKKHADGLICSSACLAGEIPRTFLNAGAAAAEKVAQKYLNLFGENFYLEIQSHPNLPDQKTANDFLIELSRKLKIPLVATNDIHYTRPTDADAHDTLLCIQTNAMKSDEHRMSMLDGDFSLRTAEKMRADFAENPEACDNTLKIAEKCNFEFEFGKILLPKFETKNKKDFEVLRENCAAGIEKRFGFKPEILDGKLVANFSEATLSKVARGSDAAKIKKNENKKIAGENLNEKIENKICEKNSNKNVSGNKGLKPLVSNSEEILDRINFELETIIKMGFASYFLIVADFVKWAHENKIATGPGRGSAAGSLVSFVLKITDLNPLDHGLFFERFLNPQRVSMPDIDLDFEDERRDEVINYVREKYGRDRVAQICTFGTMAARAAVKDVGRVFGISFLEMNDFVKLISDRPGTTLIEAEKESKELREDLKNNSTHREIFQTAKKLEGCVRHVSVHACAVVISPDEIENHTPLQHPPKNDDLIITQFSQKPIDELGLLKMDFLGLRNISIIQRAKKIIKRTKNIEIDFSKIKIDDDPKTWKLLQKAETVGVFQLESAGMRRYLKELKPTNFDDIVAMVSLYRPGPMENIPQYISGKHNPKSVKYPHPILKNFLRETYGIAVYQEQVQRIAQDFAGFTLGEGYLLIKAVGKKIPELLFAQKQKFIDGAIKKGHSKSDAERIFEIIEPFANYGFNKAHAASYATISARTAYLKANFPTEFSAALLSCDSQNTEKVVRDISECESLGIEILPPSVNESLKNFTFVAEKKIRFGFEAIKGIGDSVVDEILKAREKSGKFKNLEDFILRVPAKIITKKSIESLAKSGALSDFVAEKTAIENHEIISKFARDAEKQKENQNLSLFGGADETAKLNLNPTEPATTLEKLNWEKEILGLFVSGHPLKNSQNFLAKKGSLIAEFFEPNFPKSTKVSCGGVLNSVRKLTTKKGDQMAILQIEDPTGKIEVVLFPQSYEKFAIRLDEEKIFLIAGKLEERGGFLQIVADKLETVEFEFAAKKSKKLPPVDLEKRLEKLRAAAPTKNSADEEISFAELSRNFLSGLQKTESDIRKRPPENNSENVIPENITLSSRKISEGNKNVFPEKNSQKTPTVFSEKNSQKTPTVFSEKNSQKTPTVIPEKNSQKTPTVIPEKNSQNFLSGIRAANSDREKNQTPDNFSAKNFRGDTKYFAEKNLNANSKSEIWEIQIPPHFSRENLQKLRKIFDENPGETPVELNFGGKVFRLKNEVNREVCEKEIVILGFNNF
jgi:DNA polymerase-3 subunit alpha